MLTKPPFSRARLALVAAAAVAIQLAGCDAINEMLHPTPPIRFAPAGESKADLAMVEHDFPLTMDELQKLTPDNLKNFSQEQLDQIYARLAAGPIPDGAFDGGLVFPKGESGDRRLAEIVGGLPGLAVELKLHRVEDLGHALWKGKVFYRNDRLLRNRIEDLALLKPIIEGDLSTIEKIKVDGKDQWLLFPAALLRAEPARQPARVDHHRLLLHRRDSRLPPEARLPRRPQRARGARRDSHGAPRVLSRPRLRRQGVPAELHALQQGDRRARRPGLRAKRQGRRGLLAGTQARAVVAAK